MDAPEESKDEQHFELKRKFRESALTLSSACDSSVGWVASQTLLGTFWNNQDVVSGQPTLYVCHACGSIIHPGFRGTTLRVARSKKSEVTQTLRRREQRRKRKAAISKQKRDSNVPRSVDSIRKEGTTLVMLEDDPCLIDRHHLVITCGRCRSSVRCKGLKREESNSRGLSGTESPSNLAQRKEIASSLKSTSDFVALPPVPAEPANPLQVQTGKRKVKKKKTSPPKSNLMNFLNSLND